MIPIKTSAPASTTARIIQNLFISLFCIKAPRCDYRLARVPPGFAQIAA